MLGTYLTVALTHMLRGTEPERPSVTDTTSSAYTSTTGSASTTASSWSESEGRSRSQGHSDVSPLLPSRASFSRSVQTSDSLSTGESVSAGVSTSTAWGMTTSKATGDSDSLALALQRSREFLVEQHELQQLPASAMIITYAGPAGRQVIMADANPGIGELGAATELTLEEFRRQPVPRPALSGDEAVPGPVSWRSGDRRPPPNLGPPPPRLDWRKRR